MSSVVPCLCLFLFGTTSVSYAQAVPLEESIAAILSERCVRCHNGSATASEPKGGLDLSTIQGMLRGGDSGPAIQAGKPDDSLLYIRVEEGSMPPIGDGEVLSRTELDAIRRWIQLEAAWPADRVLRSEGMPDDPQLSPKLTDDGATCPTKILTPQSSLRCAGFRHGVIRRRPRMRSN